MLSIVSTFLWRIGFKKLGCRLFLWDSNRKALKYINRKEM